MAISHNRTVPFWLADASMLPWGLNATLVTGPALPVTNEPSSLRVATSQNRTVPFPLPDASMLPSEAERDAVDEACWSAERSEQPAGGGIPQPHRAVPAACGEHMRSGLNATLV